MKEHQEKDAAQGTLLIKGILPVRKDAAHRSAKGEETNFATCRKRLYKYPVQQPHVYLAFAREREEAALRRMEALAVPAKPSEHPGRHTVGYGSVTASDVHW